VITSEQAIAALYGPATYGTPTPELTAAAAAAAAAHAPRDPAAVKLATAMRQRGIEPEEEVGAPVPQKDGNDEQADEQQNDEQQNDEQADEGEGNDNERADEHNEQADEYVPYTPSDAALATYGSVMRDLIAADVQRLGADPAAAEANAAEVAGIMEAFAVTSGDADYIVQVAVAAAANGISDEQSQRNQAQAWDSLRTDYGDAAQHAAQLAAQLVAQHPTVREYLAHTGLGNHPKIVAVVAQQAWRLHQQGKL
jgi:hypothetical protein